MLTTGPHTATPLARAAALLLAAPRGAPPALSASAAPRVRAASSHARAAFVDRVRLQAIGGRGGKGVVSFENVLLAWKRRPTGGSGGRGGDVLVAASPAAADLRLDTYVARGRPGGDAGGGGANGRAGAPRTLLVPPGTLVKEVRRVFVLDAGDAAGEAEARRAAAAAEEEEEEGGGWGGSDGPGGQAATAASEAAEASGDPDGGGEPDSDADAADAGGRGGRGGGGGGERALGRRRPRSRASRAGGAAAGGGGVGVDGDGVDGDGAPDVGGGDAPDARGASLRPSERLVFDDKLRSVRSAGLDPALASPAAARRASAPPGGALGPVSSSSRASAGAGALRVSAGGLLYRETLTVLADLAAPGESVLVARGGRPGVGNRGVPAAVTAAEREEEGGTPHVTGAPGEVRFLELELKTIADAGLVGFPNAGKSSFLGAVSRARPRVADYPFTTLAPSVGRVYFRDGASLSLADVPGLVEGAHADRGLGHAFLRHVERCPALVYIIDAAGPDPAGDLAALQAELRLYSPGLPARPSLVVAHKSDAGERAAAGAARLRAATALPVLRASARTGEGVGAVVEALRWLLGRAAAARGEAAA